MRGATQSHGGKLRGDPSGCLLRKPAERAKSALGPQDGSPAHLCESVVPRTCDSPPLAVVGSLLPPLAAWLIARGASRLPASALSDALGDGRGVTRKVSVVASAPPAASPPPAAGAEESSAALSPPALPPWCLKQAALRRLAAMRTVAKMLTAGVHGTRVCLRCYGCLGRLAGSTVMAGSAAVARPCRQPSCSRPALHW